MVVPHLQVALRSFRRRPAFTLVAVLTLALGLGANAAIFSVLRAVFLAPLPYPSPDELVRVVGFDRETATAGNLAPADFLDFQRDTRTFARMGAHGWVGFFTVADPSGLPERVGGVNVTEGYFPVLGAQFALGRAFTRDEDQPNAPTTVVLSHGFWQRRFGGDRTVIGRQISLNGAPAVIVGVLDERFRHVEVNPERAADVYAPYGFATDSANRGGRFIRAVGRLRAEATVTAARAELETIAARLERDYPENNTAETVLVSPLHDAMVSSARPMAALLMAAVGFLLLVACANLANLLLANGVSRRAEMAVRAAMGASRRQLATQMLTESVLLAGVGAVAGLALAAASTTVLARLTAPALPRVEDLAVDGAVLAYGVILALLTGVAAGLVPALQVSRGDVQGALRDGGRGQVRAGLTRTTRDVFVAAQVALALVLLIGAALMTRSLTALLDVAPGFSTETAVTFDVAVPLATYPEGRQIDFYQRFFAALTALPGVDAVAAINILPLSANYDSRGVQIDARPRPPGQGHSIQARSISPNYFDVMGMPLVRGRRFTAQDIEGQPRVVIISESMARRFWPGENPIGQRLTFNSGIPRAQQQNVGGAGSREIVGVVGDVKHLGLDEAEVPMFYTPQAQQPSYHTMSLVVRTAHPAVALASPMRQALASLDPTVPLYRVRTMEALVRATVAAPEMRSWLLGLFATLAGLLSVVGVYGVVAYVTQQRTREIGVRLALGASHATVVRDVVSDGLRPVVVGVAAGVLITIAGARFLQGLLFGIQATDPPTYASVGTLLLASAAIAAFIPARRALRIDSIAALRD